jgi:hypothetical protein
LAWIVSGLVVFAASGIVAPHWWDWLDDTAKPLGAESKRFFFEKKKQKTFANWPPGVAASRSKGLKVFWFFFSKKNFLLTRPLFQVP